MLCVLLGSGLGDVGFVGVVLLMLMMNVKVILLEETRF